MTRYGANIYYKDSSIQTDRRISSNDFVRLINLVAMTVDQLTIGGYEITAITFDRDGEKMEVA